MRSLGSRINPWLLAGAALLGLARAGAAEVIYAAGGSVPADIQATVDALRGALGSLNANNPGSVGSGRREINWDGVPDGLSAPNAFPGDFFNANLAGRARGAVFSTPGTSFQVSGNAASGVPVEFGNINPAYPGLFQAFSAPRLFTALGSAVTDVQFFIPGSTTPALTRGFGAVFTDVDLANTTNLQFFGAGNTLLGTFFAPPGTTAQGGLSFLGVEFGGAVVSRVRITSGNAALGGNEVGGVDLVVMDDFIYGEPVAASAVPEPMSLALFGAGLLGLGLTRQRRAG